MSHLHTQKKKTPRMKSNKIPLKITKQPELQTDYFSLASLHQFFFPINAKQGSKTLNTNYT